MYLEPAWSLASLINLSYKLLVTRVILCVVLTRVMLDTVGLACVDIGMTSDASSPTMSKGGVFRVTSCCKYQHV